MSTISGAPGLPALGDFIEKDSTVISELLKVRFRRVRSLRSKQKSGS